MAFAPKNPAKTLPEVQLEPLERLQLGKHEAESRHKSDPGANFACRMNRHFFAEKKVPYFVVFSTRVAFANGIFLTVFAVFSTCPDFSCKMQSLESKTQKHAFSTVFTAFFADANTHEVAVWTSTRAIFDGICGVLRTFEFRKKKPEIAVFKSQLIDPPPAVNGSSQVSFNLPPPTS